MNFYLALDSCGYLYINSHHVRVGQGNLKQFGRIMYFNVIRNMSLLCTVVFQILICQNVLLVCGLETNPDGGVINCFIIVNTVLASY